MSFSLTTTAWPLWLGEEEGTLPFGRALRNNESTIEGALFSSSLITKSFLASELQADEAKTTMNKIRDREARRAIRNSDKIIQREQRQKETEKEVIGVGGREEIIENGRLNVEVPSGVVGLELYI